MGVVVGTQARITYVPEVTRGVTPASPAMKVLRGTGRNINYKKAALESKEVSTSRQRADVRHGFGRIDGPLNFELGMTVYDDWLAYLMARPNDVSASVTPADNTAATSAHHNGWFQPAGAVGATQNIGVANRVAATSSAPGTMDFTIANAGTTSNWIDLGYRPGDWVVSSAFASADNNSGTANTPAEWRVMKLTGTNMTVQIPAGYTSAGVNVAGNATNKVDYKGRKLSIGTTLTTMTIERGFVEPVNPLYQVFPGCGIGAMDLNVTPDDIIGGTFTVLGGLSGVGLSTVKIDNTSSLDASPDAAPTNSPFAAFDGAVHTVKSDGTYLSAIVTQVNFKVDNQRSLLPVVGQRFSGDLYEGVAKITGTITLLLDSRDHLTAFQDESALSTMVLRFNELGTTEFQSHVFHRVKYMTADIDPPQNGPVTIQCTFEALEQTFTGNAGSILTRETYRIQRSTTA